MKCVLKVIRLVCFSTWPSSLTKAWKMEARQRGSLSGRKRGRALVQRAVRRPGFCLRCSGTQQTDTFLSVELKHNFTTCFFETLTWSAFPLVSIRWTVWKSSVFCRNELTNLKSPKCDWKMSWCDVYLSGNLTNCSEMTEISNTTKLNVLRNYSGVATWRSGFLSEDQIKLLLQSV